MTVEATCPICGGRIQIDPSASGGRITCRLCGKELALPGAKPVVLDHAPQADVPGYVSPPDRDVIGAPTCGFWGDAARSFTAPLRRGGLVTFLIVLIIQGLIVALGFAPIVGIIGQFFALGWLYAFYLNIISHTAGGEDTFPDVGMSDGIGEDIVKPFFRFIGSFLWVWLPAGVYAFVSALNKGLLTEEQDAVVVFGLWFLGMFIWPMTVLTIAIFGFNPGALRYDLQVRTIVKALPQYLSVWVLLMLTIGRLVLATLADAGGGDSTTGAPNQWEWMSWTPESFVGMIAMAVVQSYMILVAMRVIGLFYRHYKHLFVWAAE